MGEDGQNLLLATVVAMSVSVGIAWLVLRSVFGSETPAKLVSASGMVILYPYAALLLYATAYAVSPIGGYDRWSARWYMMYALALASAALLIVLWWLLFVRQTKGESWAYKAVAVTGVIAGACLVGWRRDQLDADVLFDSFSWATPAVLLSSFLVAVLTLQSVFDLRIAQRQCSPLFSPLNSLARCRYLRHHSCSKMEQILSKGLITHPIFSLLPRYFL
jgi:hypothetical protein